MRQQQRKQQVICKLQQDQLAIVATLKPRKHQAKFQASRYEGPTARQDAENAERMRWVLVFADLLRSTPTPMGALLAEKPGSVQLLGGGRRASTIRITCEVHKNSCLARSPTPSHLPQSHPATHRLSSGCASRSPVTGLLRRVFTEPPFLVEMAGVDAEARFTSNQLYTVVNKELSTTALPGQPRKQGSRMLIAVLAALEKMVADSSQVRFFRLFAWWLGILRFSDHRGLLPSDVKCSGGSLQTKLSRSKTLGADREVQSRLVYIDQACFIASPERLMQGWDLLTSIANFNRDYLVPSPSENFSRLHPQRTPS